MSSTNKQLPSLHLYSGFLLENTNRSANNEHGQIPPDGVGRGVGVTLIYQLYGYVPL